MTKQQRQQAMLAALLVVLAVVGGRWILGAFGGAGAGGASTASGRGLEDGFSVGSIEELRIAELELEPETFELGRDPFRFVTAAPPPEPKPQPQRVSPPRPRPERTAAPGPAEPARPQPPAVDVVYLGRFGPESRPIAVFSDGREIFNAFEGGVLKGAFVVDKIGYESADLKFVGFPDAPSERLAVGG